MEESLCIVSTKKVPQDGAELEELRSWDHEPHFIKMIIAIYRSREKTCLLQATQHDFTPTTVAIL